MAIQTLEGFDNTSFADRALLSGWTAIGTASGGSILAGRLSGSAIRLATSTQVTNGASEMSLVKVLTGAPTNVFIGAAVRVTSNDDPASAFTIRGPTAPIAKIWIYNSGLVSIVGPGTTVLASSAPGVFPIGVWNFLEVRFDIITPTIQVRVNGNPTAVLTYGTAFANGNASIDRAGLGSISSSGSTVITSPEVDDLYILDSTGAAPRNTFLGDVRIVGRLPTADVVVAWTPFTAGNNFGNVDEATENGDTDYVSNAVATTRDRYSSTTTIPGTTPTVFGVATRLWAKKDDAVARTFRNILRSGATDSAGTTQTLTTSYLGFEDVHPLDPATGVSWTKAGVEASQFGPEVVS